MTPQYYETLLTKRGWVKCDVTARKIYRKRAGYEQITWWRRGDWLYPQFLALDFERLGWVKILDTL